MWCVTAAIFDVMSYMRCIVSMDCCMASACFSMSAMRFFIYSWFSTCVVFCMLIWNGIEVCSIGAPNGLVIVWTRATPGCGRRYLAIRSSTNMPAGLRMS